jgi:hypothetical protein
MSINNDGSERERMCTLLGENDIVRITEVGVPLMSSVNC